MSSTAHIDTFARDRLPPREQWPQLIFALPELQYPDRLNCATELLDKAVDAGGGERPALRFGEEMWTYRDLLERANGIAHVLVRDMGLLPGNRVLLRGANTPMMAACWLAVMKAGAIAVATMPLLRAAELVQVVNKAEISHCLCDRPLCAELNRARPDCPTLREVQFFRDPQQGLEARMARFPKDFVNVDTAADDICLIAFTSGTTGLPKGTMHFHRDVMAICDCFPRSILKPEPDDVFCGTPPFAFTFGLGGQLLFPLRFGASAVLAENLDARDLLQLIQDHHATICFTAPTSYRALAEHVPSYDLRSLRKCVSAGEVLPAATRRLWREATGIELIDGIGSTEMLHIFISAAGEDVRPGATGKPIPGYRARVVDAAGHPLPAGSIGRLAVIGPTGCRYLDDPRQADYVQHGWNITGDAYVVDEEGYFHYCARDDDLIISAGYNISGPEVEEVLASHPAVGECAVVGVPDQARGQIVKAFVVLQTGHEASPELVREMQEWTKKRIAPYKYPRSIEFVATLPRTETGKLQRFRLRSPTGATPPTA